MAGGWVVQPMCNVLRWRGPGAAWGYDSVWGETNGVEGVGDCSLGRWVEDERGGRLERRVTANAKCQVRPCQGCIV